MSVEKITEKLDSIEAQQAAKIEEAKVEVRGKGELSSMAEDFLKSRK